MSPMPLMGKTLLNTTEVSLNYWNFDAKYKDFELDIPELGLSARVEIFKSLPIA